MATALRRILPLLIGCVGAYTALWPIQEEAFRWVALIGLILLMIGFWIVDGLRDRDAAAEQAERDRGHKASIQELQRHLRDQLPLEGTLRERAIKMALSINEFLRRRAAIEPDWLEMMRGLQGDALRDVYVELGGFYAETLALYQQRYARRVSSLLDELLSTGAISREQVSAARTCDSHFDLHKKVVELLYRTGQGMA